MIDDFLTHSLAYLHSIYLYYPCLTFRHWQRTLHSTRVSHERSNICLSVITLLSPHHLYLQWRVCLPWTGHGCYGIHSTHTRVTRNYFAVLLPSVSSVVYGISFSPVWHISSLHSKRSLPPWKRDRASRRALDKALPSLPSCLSASRCRTLRARCRFMSPFCECANGTFVDYSRSHHSRLFSIRFASQTRATVPAS